MENTEQKFSLPTGKNHVSYSEIKDFNECSWRHYLKNIQKLTEDIPSVHLVFGTAVHEICENYLKTKVIDCSLAENILNEYLEQNKDNPKWTPYVTEKEMVVARKIANDIPKFLDEKFPGWEYVSAEETLYENLDFLGHDDVKFKGFIDAVIKCKNEKGKELYWIIDWKTASRPWGRDKLENPLVTSQVALYKSFWAKRNPQIKFRDVRCAYVVLNKKAKAGKVCSLNVVSVGEETEKKSLRLVGNAISSIKNGIKIKIKTECKYCPYNSTEWCT